MNEAVDSCAQILLETIPLVMRNIRAEIRSRRFPEFSLVQFRAMAFIGRHRGANLSGVAEHLGLTLPAASRLVDGLVTAKCVTRGLDSNDRRKIWLDLTRDGDKRYGAARDSARRLLASRIATLPPAKVTLLSGALDCLAGLFQAGDPPAAPVPEPRGQAASPALKAPRKPSPKKTSI